MRIVKEGAICYPYDCKTAPGGHRHAYAVENTIEINLDDFDAWYKATYWRQEGGLIHYTSVSWYIKQWLDSAMFMSTDLEAK